MKVYNTLVKEKVKLETLEEGKVKIYACGPTVYNLIHIGNARPVCVFDVLRRYLEYKGYQVEFAQNFTDIDDKIINRAKDENTTYDVIAEKYIEEYKKDARGLNIKDATYHPKATENIDEIIDIISTLVKEGYAYEVQGDVYFSPKKFDEYGKLSNQPLEDLEAGARIMVGETKREPMDFALWKAAKAGEPAWESPWGQGRPGWHIECSAMARRYLGKTIDIHGGGQDLIFPHHENEIAQSECCNGVTFANYWMHNGYINIDNKKMSKSLGNFFTVRDVAEKYGYEPIRYLLISAHYRSPINYSVEMIEQSIASLERLYNARENLVFFLEKTEDESKGTDTGVFEALKKHKASFMQAMDDDLNTADALASVFELVRDIYALVIEKEASRSAAEKTLALFDELTDVLGLLYNKREASPDEEVEKLIEQRNLARAEKDWAKADEIRDRLKAMGVVLEDTPQGVKWHKEH
ncbi:MAG: cysteine--tRNA ligase [Clostridiales bacterium]|nr:cysteine--tRNA ligase [Clostridiales bacterium]